METPPPTTPELALAPRRHFDSHHKRTALRLDLGGAADLSDAQRAQRGSLIPLLVAEPGTRAFATGYFGEEVSRASARDAVGRVAAELVRQRARAKQIIRRTASDPNEAGHLVTIELEPSAPEAADPPPTAPGNTPMPGLQP